jgi:hypothetical protein
MGKEIVSNDENGTNGDVRTASRVLAEALDEAGLSTVASMVSTDDDGEIVIVRLNARQARDLASLVARGMS